MLKYFIIIFLGFTSLVFSTFWDQEYWLFMRCEQWNKSPYKFYYSGEVRSNHAMKKVYHYRMSENFLYEARPHLDLEAHYSYIFSKPKDSCHFRNTSRYELEINPYFSIKNSHFRFRNRIEFIKRNRETDWQYVFRQRTSLRFLVKNMVYITSIGMNNEFFFDFKRDQITQNRFVPLEVSFKFSSINLNAFIMIRDLHSFNFNRWLKSFVVGTEISF